MRFRLERAGARFVQLGDAQVIERAATGLADGKGLGWFRAHGIQAPRPR
jgi:hypothetical protein